MHTTMALLHIPLPLCSFPCPAVPLFIHPQFLGLPTRPSLADIEREGEKVCSRGRGNEREGEGQGGVRHRELMEAGEADVQRGAAERRKLLSSGLPDQVAGSRRQSREEGWTGGRAERIRGRGRGRVVRDDPSPMVSSALTSVGEVEFVPDSRQAVHAAAAAAGDATSVARYCFSSAYIVAFLRNVLHVPLHEKR